MTDLTGPKRKLRVAVLMGGASSERPISLSTGAQIVAALDRDRYSVIAIDTKDLLALKGKAPQTAALADSGTVVGFGMETDWPQVDGSTTARVPARQEETEERTDVVFIALHGKGGEDGTVQGLLEFMGLPYTGSGILASALAMDKSMTKRLLASADIPVIEGRTVHAPDVQSREGFEAKVGDWVVENLGYPVFVKPNAEGSTFGCSLVSAAEALYPAVVTALTYDSGALIERYMRGIEITVGVLENRDGDPEALPVIEIVPKSAYYDYESKYADGGSEHIIPARLPAEVMARAQNYALRCHALLGCRGMSRTDMIVYGQNLYVLEINTIPGMTPTSLLPQAAAYVGIAFPELLDRMIASAMRSVPEFTNA